MKQYFDKVSVMKAEHYAISKFPEEACGFITHDDFIPCENIADDKVKNFKIDKYEYFKYHDQIQCIVHSHANYPHLSAADMEGQIRSNLPWGLILLNNGKVQHTVFWGDMLEPEELIGRPFIHGLFDCYGVVRDYWRAKGYWIKDFPRDNLWWETQPSMLEDNCRDAGFDFIDESEVKNGDVVFMKVVADVVNHSGIYLGDGLILHHLYNRLSRTEPLNRWRKFVTGYLRCKHA